MVEITVDKDEWPRGHSARKVHEDENCTVYLGTGNTFKDSRYMASVHFKNFPLTIQGGKSFSDFIETRLNDAYKSAWQYLFGQHLVSDEDKQRLEELGFHESEYGFDSYRFGSC